MTHALQTFMVLISTNLMPTLILCQRSLVKASSTMLTVGFWVHNTEMSSGEDRSKV